MLKAMTTKLWFWVTLLVVVGVFLGETGMIENFTTGITDTTTNKVSEVVDVDGWFSPTNFK